MTENPALPVFSIAVPEQSITWKTFSFLTLSNDSDFLSYFKAKNEEMTANPEISIEMTVFAGILFARALFFRCNKTVAYLLLIR